MAIKEHYVDTLIVKEMKKRFVGYSDRVSQLKKVKGVCLGHGHTTSPQ